MPSAAPRHPSNSDSIFADKRPTFSLSRSSVIKDSSVQQIKQSWCKPAAFLGRGGFDKQAGWIVFLVQVGCDLGDYRVTQAVILIVGLDHHDGPLLAAAAGRMGETRLQNVAAPQVHESSGSSQPSPANRSAASAANKSISSFDHGP
jgi:hypothetical protein